MAFELTSWLKDLNAEGALTNEELASLQAVLGKEPVLKRVQALHEGGLRQEEFSRRMGELSDKEKATLNLRAELVKWREDAELKLKNANLTAGEERKARADIDAKLRRAAELYQFDPEALGVTSGGTGADGGTANGNRGADTRNPEFLTKKEWDEATEQMKRNYPMLPAVLFDLSAEHQTLFGKPLESTTALVQKAIETGKPIREVWEAEHKVAERRALLQEEKIQQRIDTAVADREAKLRSELQLPAPPRADARSPVLEQFKPPATTGAGNQPELSGVDRAVAAYNEHKYRPPEPATTR